MLRAAPGEDARGALRRKFIGNPRISVVYHDGYTRINLYPGRMGNHLHPAGSRSNHGSTFTRKISSSEVELGRLGEVVSLVGDCRPPPPGNPRRPITPGSIPTGSQGKYQNQPGACLVGSFFSVNVLNTGGFFLTVWKQSSFNNYRKITNLKELNKFQYFKNNCSFSSCMRCMHVLKFCTSLLPPMRVIGSETPVYSDYKCSSNIGLHYALSIL